VNRPEYKSTHEQRDAVESQFARFALALDCAEPRDLPRTYGFEIETPDADTVQENAIRAIRAHNAGLTADNLPTVNLDTILDWKGDGSVTSPNQNEECECECSDCVYHECSCDYCENTNTDPEHGCGSDYCYNAGTYQEITSVGGTTTTHPLSLEILADAKLYEAEVNDTCGVHIHVGSADLTPVQVASVISAYRALADILDPIAERAGAYYCQANTDEDLARARRGEGTEKYRAVNTAPHFSNYRPDTIEFRQHAGTVSTVAIRAWAVLLVHLVEYAKRNRPVYWLARCRDFDELAKELDLKA
jgi:hypothetical protein